MRSKCICVNGRIPFQLMIAADLDNGVVEAAAFVERGSTAVVLQREQPLVGVAHAAGVAVLLDLLGGGLAIATSVSRTIRLSRTSTRRRRAHVGATILRAREHALGGEAFQGFTDRAAAHLIVPREVGFDQTLYRAHSFQARMLRMIASTTRAARSS